MMFLWIGIGGGSISSMEVFRHIKTVKMRGLAICSLLIPMCLFADFLMWSFENGKFDGMP